MNTSLVRILFKNCDPVIKRYILTLKFRNLLLKFQILCLQCNNIVLNFRVSSSVRLTFFGIFIDVPFNINVKITVWRSNA